MPLDDKGNVFVEVCALEHANEGLCCGSLPQRQLRVEIKSLKLGLRREKVKRFSFCEEQRCEVFEEWASVPAFAQHLSLPYLDRSQAAG